MTDRPATRSQPADPEVTKLAHTLSNWGRWGDDDQLGTLNFITRANRVAAAAEIRRGETFSLALPLNRHGPQPASGRRLNPQLTMLQTGTDLATGTQPGAVQGWGCADDMVTMALQCATHWDALAHAFYDYRMYNGLDCKLVDVHGARRNDVAAMCDAIVTRAVLCDLPRALGIEFLEPDRRIDTTDLERALQAQRVDLGPGDVLLIRTGHLARARRQGDWTGYVHADEPGLCMEALPWVHERRLAAMASDTWAFEVLPSGKKIGLPVHAIAIVHMGMPLGEMFDLERLADDCASDGMYTMAFNAPPLPFTGAVGSPVNPIVIK